MKTKEEIEKLAEFQFPSAITKEGCKFGFIKGYTKCQEDIEEENQDWINFESELMDWAHELGREQKYIPFPVQVLEWLKNNYKIPQKK
jgi:hypothetical protein